MAAILYSAAHSQSGRRSRRRPRPRWKTAVLWYIVVGLIAFFPINWIYQAIRKPGEILAPIGGSFIKTPESTWHAYGSLFQRHSTDIISPELLAALAQVESSGNPLARSYWRWQWSWNPFEIYRPASSALGMFQITDATFVEARKYCIRDQQVVIAGPWHDFSSCWFNRWYTRTLPSHSIEMTSAYLHQSVVNTLGEHRLSRVSRAQKQKLAAVIHLCGPKRGKAFAKRGFRSAAGERCGSHGLQRYLTNVDSMRQRFVHLRERSAPSSSVEMSS